MGDAFLRFDFAFGPGLGDGVGEIFFCFGEAVGDGLGVGFFAERFRCFRVGVGVGVGSKIFLIFVPNDSSAASTAAQGLGGTGDTDGVPNTDAQFWGAFSTDGGQTFTKNFQISAGTSNSRDALNGIDYGDYTGLSFYGGIAHPVWADNSNSTSTNPDGTLHQLDDYTAAVSIVGR